MTLPHFTPSPRLIAFKLAILLATPWAAAQTQQPPQPAHQPPSPQALFFSGHSLLDNPLPDDVEQIAKSLGQNTAYEQQNIPGSPIRVRTRGMDPNARDWAGYRQGKNRQQSNKDVLAELAQPRTVPKPYRYDTLVITERHDLLGSLIWEDTMRYLRHFHDRLIDANPAATTWFYQPWLGVPDKGNPQSWIDYERASAPVWQCVTTRINRSLEAEGRPDRLRALATNLALAELVERATQRHLEGISQPNVRQTMNRIFSDEVHLTRLGVYYMALVTYANVFQRSPMGAWAPPQLSSSQAATLQYLAWEITSRPAATASLSSEQCGALVRQSFCSTYWHFVKRPNQLANCQRHFADHHADNPFRFDAATDRRYWLTAP